MICWLNWPRFKEQTHGQFISWETLADVLFTHWQMVQKQKRMILPSSIHKTFLCGMWCCWFDACCFLSKIFDCCFKDALWSFWPLVARLGNVFGKCVPIWLVSHAHAQERMSAWMTGYTFLAMVSYYSTDQQVAKKCSNAPARGEEEKDC